MRGIATITRGIATTMRESVHPGITTSGREATAEDTETGMEEAAVGDTTPAPAEMEDTDHAAENMTEDTNDLLTPHITSFLVNHALTVLPVCKLI